MLHLVRKKKQQLLHLVRKTKQQLLHLVRKKEQLCLQEFSLFYVEEHYFSVSNQYINPIKVGPSAGANGRSQSQVRTCWTLNNCQKIVSCVDECLIGGSSMPDPGAKTTIGAS